MEKYVLKFDYDIDISEVWEETYYSSFSTYEAYNWVILIDAPGFAIVKNGGQIQIVIK